jgi:hypothetical protein
MSNPIDIEQIERDARRVVEAKVTTVRKLAQARATRISAAAAYDSAEAADLAAYNAAVEHGWTSAELRQLGLDEPAKDRGADVPPMTAGSHADDSTRHDALGYLSSVK